MSCIQLFLSKRIGIMFFCLTWFWLILYRLFCRLLFLFFVFFVTFQAWLWCLHSEVYGDLHTKNLDGKSFLQCIRNLRIKYVNDMFFSPLNSCDKYFVTAFFVCSYFPCPLFHFPFPLLAFFSLPILVSLIFLCREAMPSEVQHVHSPSSIGGWVPLLSSI